MTESEHPTAQPAPPAPSGSRGPWSFLVPACRGGFSPWGLQVIASWLCFSLLTSMFWAQHLRRLLGWSSLANYWGERLAARDLWELLENGGLKTHWTGSWTALAAVLTLAWSLWAGWRLQARSAGQPAPAGAWFWGILDALVVGAVPLALPALAVLWGLSLLAAGGSPVLAWLAWVGSALVRLSYLSMGFLQWWLCRQDRVPGPPGPIMGSWARLGRHLIWSAGLLWRHPLQWATLVLGGVALRCGISLLALAVAWRLGGSTIPRVCAGLALELVAAGINAWLLGWFLRLAGLYGSSKSVGA